MADPRHYYYNANVRLVGDYFVMTIPVQVSVDADEDLHSGEIQDRAVERANKILSDYYGWDNVDQVSKQVEITLGDGY